MQRETVRPGDSSLPSGAGELVGQWAAIQMTHSLWQLCKTIGRGLAAIGRPSLPVAAAYATALRHLSAEIQKRKHWPGQELQCFAQPEGATPGLIAAVLSPERPRALAIEGRFIRWVGWRPYLVWGGVCCWNG